MAPPVESALPAPGSPGPGTAVDAVPPATGEALPAHPTAVAAAIALAPGDEIEPARLRTESGAPSAMEGGPLRPAPAPEAPAPGAVTDAPPPRSGLRLAKVVMTYREAAAAAPNLQVSPGPFPPQRPAPTAPLPGLALPAGPDGAVMQGPAPAAASGLPQVAAAAPVSRGGVAANARRAGGEETPAPVVRAGAPETPDAGTPPGRPVPNPASPSVTLAKPAVQVAETPAGPAAEPPAGEAKRPRGSPAARPVQDQPAPAAPAPPSAGPALQPAVPAFEPGLPGVAEPAALMAIASPAGATGLTAAPAGAPAAAPAPPPAPVATVAAAAVALAVDPGSGQIDIRLSPEDLGQVQLTLAREGDTLRVLVAADRPETLDLMRRHGETLQAELRAAGFGEASLSFAGRGDGSGQGWRMAPEGQAPSETLADRDPQPPPPREPPQGRAGLDLRL